MSLIERTQLIGLKEFREGISGYAKKVQRQKKNYLVLKRNKPVFHVSPPTDEERRVLTKLEADIAEAREQVKQGKTYTTEEVRQKLGL